MRRAIAPCVALRIGAGVGAAVEHAQQAEGLVFRGGELGARQPQRHGGAQAAAVGVDPALGRGTWSSSRSPTRR